MVQSQVKASRIALVEIRCTFTAQGSDSHECKAPANELATLGSNDRVHIFWAGCRGVAFRGGFTVRALLQQLISFPVSVDRHVDCIPME
jgi:hypothetical protein